MKILFGKLSPQPHPYDVCLTYNYLNTCNIKELEGIGSQYQKIITLYAVAKKNNIKYIYS